MLQNSWLSKILLFIQHYKILQIATKNNMTTKYTVKRSTSCICITTKNKKLRSKTWNSLVIHEKTHMCHYPATHVRWKQHTDEKKFVRLTWLAIVNTHLQKCSNYHNESSIFAYAGVKPQYGCVKPPSRSVYIYIHIQIRANFQVNPERPAVKVNGMGLGIHRKVLAKRSWSPQEW